MLYIIADCLTKKLRLSCTVENEFIINISNLKASYKSEALNCLTLNKLSLVCSRLVLMWDCLCFTFVHTLLEYT